MKDDMLRLKPKHAKGEDGYKIFSIRIADATVLQLDDIAKKTGRSRNELIGTFIEYALERCIIDDK